MISCLRCVSRRKWEPLTAWASIPVPLVWLIFSLVYWAVGGTNYDGDNYIYSVLKLVVVVMMLTILLWIPQSGFHNDLKELEIKERLVW